MSKTNFNPYSITTVKCAGPGCPNVRRLANHWFVISTADGAFLCRPYSPTAELLLTDEPVCGQLCAQRIFERYLDRRST